MPRAYKKEYFNIGPTVSFRQSNDERINGLHQLIFIKEGLVVLDMSIIIIPNNIMINTSKTIFKFAESKLSKPFTSIRVYKELSNLELLNALMVNRAANTNWLIAHSMRMYNLSSTLFTKTLTNWIIKNTFGRVFTAGETTKDVTSMMDLFQKMNIPVILDYSGEGFIDKRAIESELDKNAKMF